MTRFSTLALSLTLLVVHGTKNITLDAQTTASAKQSPSITVSVSIQMDKLPAGPRPWAVVTVKNVGNRYVSLGTDMRDYRVHVDGEQGESPKTSYHRSIRGEFQPGDRDLAGGGPVDSVPPGKSEVHKFDLTKFYDLKVPGKYSVYIEVRDELSGTWLRSDTVQFTMQTSAR